MLVKCLIFYKVRNFCNNLFHRNLTMIKLILVPGLLCTRELFKNQIYALENICDIEIADTLGMNSILDMAQNIVRNESSEFVIAVYQWEDMSLRWLHIWHLKKSLRWACFLQVEQRIRKKKKSKEELLLIYQN